MKKIFLQLTMITAMIILPFMSILAQNVWINEIHYDDASTDANEFVEIVLENAGSYTLADFTITLYNGSSTSLAPYDTKTLGVFTMGSTVGNFTFYYYNYTVNSFSIQNGAPDGLCVDYQGTVIAGQFLSYEGTFTPTSGPAIGITSIDIGVLEVGEPDGLSLQLSGSGTQYSSFTWQSPATATMGNLNNSQSFGGVVVPVIVNAYAKSTTLIDLDYNLDLTSVDPGDYSLTGTANITIASATIDGTDASIVHLVTNSVMASDITLDNIADDLNGTNFDFYAGIMLITFTNATNPGGVMDNLHPATFNGIISANDAFNNVWISDAAGDYHGVMIFSTTFDALVAVGDEILFQAKRDVYNNLTELINPLLISKLSTGNTPYGPTTINGSDIDEAIVANTNPAESWEGQLVQIQNFVVESYVAYDYRCSWTSGPNTYYFHIGDNVDFQFLNVSLTVGATYQSITGVVDWYNTSGDYRINPRNQADVVPVSNPAVKLVISSVNNGADPFVNVDFAVTVQAQDAGGNPAFPASNINFTFTTNGGTGGTVGFVPGSTTTGTILAGFSEAIVTGVKMAPVGTNVTITATDNNPFGLLAGISASFDVVEYVIPDIIICEIMKDPALPILDDNGEWFEVYNNGNEPVDMNGWILKDDGIPPNQDSHVIAGTLIVPANGFAVLGIKSDPLLNGNYTCNYQYSNFQLANVDDEIVLFLPDGVTEIDRVNYLGVAPWVDPIGASMIFAGLPSDNNNDGTKWIISILREPSFVGATGDLGSPGTLGTGQFTGVIGFSLDLKVFLEGPYDATTNLMNTNLLADNLLPLAQPFNPTLPYYGNNTPKWLYNGTEPVSGFPTGTVDYVLIELRDAASAALATSATRISQLPAFLKSDGSIVSLDGTSLPAFTNVVNDFLYIIVWSRNHVGIMSSADITPGSTVVYDFTTGFDKVYLGEPGYKLLETGVYGMAAGDINADGVVDIFDKTPLGWKVDAGKKGYFGADLNMNTQVSNKDKNDYWVPNNGTKSTQVPN
jgi:hypothetical protein